MIVPALIGRGALAGLALLGLLSGACRSDSAGGSPSLPTSVAAPATTPAALSPALDRIATHPADGGTTTDAAARLAPASPLLEPRLPVRVAHLWSTDALSVPLHIPAALAADRHGRVYVVDAGRHRLVVLGPRGDLLAEWGSEGGDAGQFRFQAADPCADDAPGLCTMEAGGGVATDADGRVYVADFGNHRIQVFDRAGRLVGGWGRAGRGPGALAFPQGIAVDRAGRVYVADTGNHRIQVFDRAGRPVRRWGRRGTGPGRFGRLGALAVDGEGRVYVADAWNGRVQVFDGRGRFLAAVAWPVTRLIGDDFASLITGIAVDGQGHLAVGDGSQVRVVDRGGRVLACWGGTSPAAVPPARPSGVTVDADGDIYVAELAPGRVGKYRPLWPMTR